MTCNKFLQNSPKKRNPTESDRPLPLVFLGFVLEAPWPPLCRYSALFAASQPGNELLQKFWINEERIEKRERPGSRTRRIKERGMEIVTKTPYLVLELMALETPTQRRRSAKRRQPVPLRIACRTFGVRAYYAHQVV
jgi:hypothetical protein